MAQKIKVIAVVGPTASGKTALAIELARRFDGEVISADSRQIYRGVDLISGKATKSEMKNIPHHMLSFVNPKYEYSAGLFGEKARKVLAEILSRGKVPIVTGGTGFYVDALLRNVSFPDVKPNKALRKKLGRKTTLELFKMLQRLDPRRVRSIDKHNPVRLIRAIEIAKELGSVPKLKTSSPYDVLWIGLLPPKNYEKKIRMRVRERIRKGMLAEAKKLRKEGLTLARMRRMGLELYHLADLIEKKVSPQEFEDRLTRDILNYSKRQMRWFKRNDRIIWFKSSRERSLVQAGYKFVSASAADSHQHVRHNAVP